MFTTAIWTLPPDYKELTYCSSGNSCVGAPFNNPTQGGYLGNGYAGNPNAVTVNVQNNKIITSWRYVNYNFAYDRLTAVPNECNKNKWQTNFWGDMEIYFHPTITDVIVIDTKITYCKDMDSNCSSKNIVTQDNQLSTLFGMGQTHPDPKFKGPYTRTAYMTSNGIVYNKFGETGNNNIENWIAILKSNEDKGIGISVKDYKSTPKTSSNVFGYYTTNWPSINAIEPEIDRFEYSKVTRKQSVVVNGNTYSDIVRYEFEPSGWYKFRTYVATGDLNTIRTNLNQASG